eukprot:TRINITY_DN6143_c0_g1_i18.p1 TRINITY_DN6143_c0_g1~~TRINITY_DN6143_c0_g1_i18.p1  ORF type:complete len:299 (-),score=61.13 TRINITY_DN6143_c0_g1_i18:157-1053(-)
MSEQILILGDFTLKSLLGKGHRSEVRLGEHGLSQFAVKCLKRIGNKLYDDESYKCYLNEVKMASALAHPHIISIVAYGDYYIFNTEDNSAESSMYIVFEYARGGSLFDFIRRTGVFSEQLARHYFAHVLDAVSYLHRSGIAHRDIKPQNILLNSSLDVLVADFDLAGAVGNYKGVVGTAGYMAPEIESAGTYSAEGADVFALGVMLFFMVVGKNPFTGTIANANYNALCAYKNKFWKRFDKNNSYSSEFRNLIEVILERDPKKRISLEEIKEHGWMKKQKISDLELTIEKVLRKESLK